MQNSLVQSWLREKTRGQLSVAQRGCDTVQNDVSGVINDTGACRFQGGCSPIWRVISSLDLARLQTEMCVVV